MTSHIYKLAGMLCIAYCILCFVSCGEDKQTLFRQLPSSVTGISFNNLIASSDSNNILDYEYLYNGGGVAVGDFNKDGLQDLYFTASMESNKLYLNKGAFNFIDITDKSGTNGNGNWCTGASVADVNADGLPDIYVCTSRYNDAQRRKNLLYINQGNNKDGVPVFKELAADYGLADTSFSTQAAFFDYDNDGDLDMYLLVAGKMQDGYQPNTYQKKVTDGSSVTNDKLFRNDGPGAAGHPHFSDVTREANILVEGFGLGLNICDINRDGWKDIYVSNDYLTNDLLWINNRNGTFTNMAGKYFKHTSYSAMGNDVQDLNNDNLADVITLDMLAKDNYRKKTMSPPGNYFNYNNNDYFGYEFQYVRNTLQLNQGFAPRSGISDSNAHPVFSEISFLSGVAETDWSWTPLVADFDNDGFRDLIVSNGFPKDLSDQDFLHFRGTSSSVATKEMIIGEMPEVKIPDYAFRNNGDLSFTDVSTAWGFTSRSFSNGAVYVDLDNDGDLDCVTNNINDPASVFKNTLNDDKNTAPHWLQLSLIGDPENPFAYGSLVTVYYDSARSQFSELAPCRGYLGSVGNRLQFGFGTTAVVDSMRITWPDHTTELIIKPAIDQLLEIRHKPGLPVDHFVEAAGDDQLFADVSAAELNGYKHQETDFIDFNEFRLLPHKFSQYGPSLAVADINGDSLDDVFVGGSRGFSGQFLIQDKSGKFSVRNLNGSRPASGTQSLDPVKVQEDQGSLLADLDNDGDVDLYIVSGGVESGADTAGYLDRVYMNDGSGKFQLADPLKTFTGGKNLEAFVTGRISGSSVKGADIDNDGDIDLVRTARIIPGQYPVAASTMILRNDSKPGSILFTDVTDVLAPFLQGIGLVTDASFTDLDSDGLVDLLLVGEWMAPVVLKNTKEGFKNISAGSGLENETGWWNSIVAADFDNDGDIDFVLGNNGTNTLYQASVTEPAGIYAKDFNKDGVFDAIPTLYLNDSSGAKKEYPAFGRDEMMKQMIQVRRRYPRFSDFAATRFDQLFTPEELTGAVVYHAVNLRSSYVENLGSGKFRISALPAEAQFAPVFGMVAEDVNDDGNPDLLLNGNDYGAELSVGKCAALNGLVLLGNGAGGFRALTASRSGVFIPGNGKALVSLQGSGNNRLILASQNNDKALLFRHRSTTRVVKFAASDRYLIIYLRNGKTRRQDLNFGDSFFSQSARSFNLTPVVDHIEVYGAGSNKRTVK